MVRALVQETVNICDSSPDNLKSLKVCTKQTENEMPVAKYWKNVQLVESLTKHQ